MSKIDAGTLADLLEVYDKSEVRIEGKGNIYVEFYVDEETGDLVYDIKAKTAEP